MRCVIKLSLLLALLFVALNEPAQAQQMPNIVFIMADDMGFECMGANGGQTYKTPNLDKLASQSVRFTQCHAQPLCTPSRVQLMTGLYNSRNYIEFGLLDPEAKTFANYLRAAGYTTCITGKWQLSGGYGKPNTTGFKGPNNFGFDEYCLWQVTRASKNKRNRYANPGFEINGKEVDYRNGEYGPDIINNYACEFIDRQAKANKPFLLYYPMMLPHWPFDPTPDSKDWDPGKRQNDDHEKNADTTSLPHFIDMVAYTDKMVGKVLAKLEEVGVRDNTLIIFTGDNGTHFQLTSVLDGKPYPGGKGKMTLNGTHVPLVVDWPGKAKAGSVCEELVDFTDMLPTMLDAAGVAMPEGFKPDGRSFLPLVRGEAGNPRQWIYSWYNPSGDKLTGEFAMNNRYKLYGGGRFYDLQNDPWEKSPIKPDDRTDEQEQAAQKLAEVIKDHTRP